MRRKDREVTEPAELLKIMGRCKVCRVAMQDAQGLYILPLNFGYEWADDGLTLYFHSAKEGRKIDILAQSPAVAFEMDCGHQLISADTACGYSYAFQSIVGTGKASLITDVDEKIKGLACLMQHQSGKAWSMTAQEADTVAVFKIEAAEFTGKIRPMPHT